MSTDKQGKGRDMKVLDSVTLGYSFLKFELFI